MSQHGSLPQTPKAACVFLTHTCTHTPRLMEEAASPCDGHLPRISPPAAHDARFCAVILFACSLPAPAAMGWTPPPPPHSPWCCRRSFRRPPPPDPGTLAGGGRPAQSPLVLPTRTAARCPPGLVITTERRSLSEEGAFFLN